jgi:hypothetical protein
LIFFDETVKQQKPVQQYISLIKSVTVNPKKNKFAAFYFKHPYFKIFSSETLYGVYHIDEEIQREEECTYFAGAYSTDKFIYVMWIAMPEEKIAENLANFKPDLLIFDWDGNIVKNYKFDVPVISFAVNNSNDKLYAVSLKEDDINAVYVCDLNIK